MMKVATYLYFKHNAAEAIQTYRTIFGAEVVRQHSYDEDMTHNPELLGKIFHAELKIGDMNLYLADSGVGPSFTSMNFVVEISEEDKARKIFENIVQNGKRISDFEVMPVGPRIARAEDKFGVTWEVVIC